jgi:carbon starvation protein CstA
MITFAICILLLILGYFLYGKLSEKVFGIDPSRTTPAVRMADGVDYVPMSWWRVFLIQFLNIAGLGPIFGAVAGAMWGPVAFLWIVLGCIFAGAFHDFFSAMLSVRNDGLSIPEIVGKYLGNGFKQFIRIFTVLLMILVGAVFIMGPAKILDGLTSEYMGLSFWVWLVFVYYILATMLPIDKLIGRIYPIFGFSLLFMALGITASMIWNGLPIPELLPQNLMNMNAAPDTFPIFPMLFVTVACGAISGFHSTQSPLMARCIQNENLGRRIFYGAMICEGVVAMIWAAVGMSFFGGVRELNIIMTEHGNNAAWAVNEISNKLLGPFGGALAILGVVAAPITSGDTAFRSARLIVADFTNLNQTAIKNRLYICVPLFFIGFTLTQMDFGIIWRYMAWSNQTLATVVLWTIAAYMMMMKKFYWMALIPAVFMTAVCSTYILVAPEGFQLPLTWGYIGGLMITLIITIVYFLNGIYTNKIPEPVS